MAPSLLGRLAAIVTPSAPSRTLGDRPIADAENTHGDEQEGQIATPDEHSQTGSQQHQTAEHQIAFTHAFDQLSDQTALHDNHKYPDIGKDVAVLGSAPAKIFLCQQGENRLHTRKGQRVEQIDQHHADKSFIVDDLAPARKEQIRPLMRMAPLLLLARFWQQQEHQQRIDQRQAQRNPERQRAPLRGEGAAERRSNHKAHANRRANRPHARRALLRRGDI